MNKNEDDKIQNIGKREKTEKGKKYRFFLKKVLPIILYQSWQKICFNQLLKLRHCSSRTNLFEKTRTIMVEGTMSWFRIYLRYGTQMSTGRVFWKHVHNVSLNLVPVSVHYLKEGMYTKSTYPWALVKANGRGVV